MARASRRFRRHRRNRRSTSRRKNSKPFARACGAWSTAAAPGGARASRVKTCAARPAPLRSSRTRDAWWRRRATRTSITATTAGSCSSLRATTRRSPAWSSSSTASTGPTPRRSRTTSSRRFSPSRTASRCRRRRRTKRCGSITRIPTRVPAAGRSAAGAANSTMFERRLYFHIDWLLVAGVLLLSAVGVAMVYSTTYVTTAVGGHASPQVRTQMTALVIGLVAMLIFLAVDYRMFAEHSLFIYGGLIVLLIFVLLKGQTQMGGQRWIPIGRFHLQPSEFGRIAVALMLAMYFGENRRGAKNPSDLVLGGIFTAIPLILIAKQPDLGTAVTLLPVFVGVAYLAGLRLRLLAVLALAGVLVAPIAWKFALKDYQRSRIETFLDPEQDPRGAGYQTIQARVTVGSGGLKGKGFMQGTQGQYKFLPVAHNDFIFSVLAEEQGFVGVLAALGLYLFVILRSLEAARLAKDRLGAYLVGGIISGFAFQVVYNVAMSTGLAPVKGITLPLMSYGGSSLIASLAGFGLILNVRMRRFTN